MKNYDLTVISDHVDNDRRARFAMIEKTIGFGNPIAEAQDRKPGGNCTRTLTDTGVIIVINPYGTIITAFVAGVKQALQVYSDATGTTKMPKKLWNMVNYNNNTMEWKKAIA